MDWVKNDICLAFACAKLCYPSKLFSRLILSEHVKVKWLKKQNCLFCQNLEVTGAALWLL